MADIEVSKIVTVEERERNKKLWITFFRRNIHRFIEMYFGIQLYPHQRLEFYLMGTNSNYAEVCSRGTAKSWKAGVFALAWGVLFPNSEILIVSESKKQAGLIIDKKIKPLRDKYENIDKEIETLVSNNSETFVKLKNGSTIFVVPLRETARGNRNTLCIREERRLLDNDKLGSIIAPMAHPRQADYLKNPKYSHLVEEPRNISITSSGRETEKWYEEIRETIKLSIKGRDSICIFADYILGLRYNMQTPNQIATERARMDDETFAIEYENALIRENKDSFFPRALIDDARILKVAYYPQHQSRYDSKKNPLGIPLDDGEKIIVSVDIALKASNDDDNTIITVDRLIPTKKGYQHNPIYQEALRGKNSIAQALRIKQIWYDFSANYIVLDANNAGTAIYDIMTEKTIDATRGIEYPAMTSMYHPTISKYEDYKQRTRSPHALPIIYPMWATDAINSDIAYGTRDALSTGRLRFLCQPHIGEEFLIEHAKYFNMAKDRDFLAWFMRPYYQASETQNEMVNLRATYSGNLVKLTEPSGGRKDRYTSIGYAVWFTKIVLDPNILKESKDVNLKDAVMITAPVQKQSSRFGSSGGFSGRRQLFGR